MTRPSTLSLSAPGAVLLAPSPATHGEEKVYDFMYYLKGAAAGGICCSITHGALTPVDVVKTRVQLDSAKVRAIHRVGLGRVGRFFPEGPILARQIGWTAPVEVPADRRHK